MFGIITGCYVFGVLAGAAIMTANCLQQRKTINGAGNSVLLRACMYFFTCKGKKLSSNLL